ncbi:MAG: division/cell wall cluster transcriptional repressor MraZ [Defluviimonas sp.]|nr:division/cell wall cluster transcriptional repressor MraZ [Defluviimonas sp.]
MTGSFRGEFSQKVDGKGRVSIPAAFRRHLEDGDPEFRARREALRGEDDKVKGGARFVIVYGDARREFLECYTVEGMAALEARILAIPRGTPRRRALERVFITLSTVAEIDGDGRIVLPQKLREKLALGEEAVFAGTADTFQIWQPEAYDRDLAEKAGEEIEGLAPGVDIAALLDRDV